MARALFVMLVSVGLCTLGCGGDGAPPRSPEAPPTAAPAASAPAAAGEGDTTCAPRGGTCTSQVAMVACKQTWSSPECTGSDVCCVK